MRGELLIVPVVDITTIAQQRFWRLEGVLVETPNWSVCGYLHVSVN